MRDRDRQLQVQHLACAHPKLSAAHNPPRMDVEEFGGARMLRRVRVSQSCSTHSTAYGCHSHYCGYPCKQTRTDI